MSPHRNRAVSIIAYVAFLLLFVELALQAFYFATAGDFLFARVGVPVFAQNEHSGIFNRANLAFPHFTNEFQATYYTNSQGLRTSESRRDYTALPAEGTYRVMLLGPSFAYGWGVDYEQSFASLLEEFLEEGKLSTAVEVINAGVPSLPAAPQLNWFRNVGRNFAPNLVIQFVYGSMAVNNRANPGAVVTEDGYLVPKDQSRGRELRSTLKKFATVFYSWVIYTQLSGSGDAEGSSREVLGAGREMSSLVDFDTDDPKIAEALELYKSLDEAVREAGSDLLIVYFPLSYAIHHEDISRWQHLGVNDVPSQLAFDAAFVKHLNDLGIPCLNATQDLQEAAVEGDRLYYWLDIHWTPKWNETVARAVAKHLLGAHRASR